MIHYNVINGLFSSFWRLGNGAYIFTQKVISNILYIRGWSKWVYSIETEFFLLKSLEERLGLPSVQNHFHKRLMAEALSHFTSKCALPISTRVRVIKIFSLPNPNMPYNAPQVIAKIIKLKFQLESLQAARIHIFIKLLLSFNKHRILYFSIIIIVCK